MRSSNSRSPTVMVCTWLALLICTMSSLAGFEFGPLLGVSVWSRLMVVVTWVATPSITRVNVTSRSTVSRSLLDKGIGKLLWVRVPSVNRASVDTSVLPVNSSA